MTYATRHYLTLLIICTVAASSAAQSSPRTGGPAPDRHAERQHAHALPPLEFIPNHRQWDDRIVYRSELGGLNQLFLENDRFTFVLFDEEQTNTLHDRMQQHPGSRDHLGMDGHVYSVRFDGAQQPTFTADRTADHRVNYLLGNDPARWAQQVPLHGRVTYGDLYPKVDLEAYSYGGNFKYDFVVRPGGDPTRISLTYDGLDGLRLHEGELVLKTSVGGLRELRPYAYQTIDGKEKIVDCRYVLDGKTVTFTLPEGYNTDLPLTIDPTVIGATLAGSALNNQSFGHSATSDNSGNMYGAGICFGIRYPTTTGAFQNTFAGGQVDIVVSKFNDEGTDLVYATYIGGSADEYPHSTIVDANGQLCMYGTSSSSNYPTTANAVQAAKRGFGDIVITKLSPDGASLVGSTYLGGDDNDGINNSPNNISNGDRYRGEIVLDNAGDIYVATCTNSTDFPVTPGAVQTGRAESGGFNEQDGVVFKLNSDLSTLFWSTYLGGGGADLASSLRVADDKSVYVSGFAARPDFVLPNGGNLLQNAPGGTESAFVLRLSANGSSILDGTYWGTSRADRSYFLDTDAEGQVHIFGLSQGDMPVTDGVYSSPGGGRQFVTGFSANLDRVIYSTVIGSSVNNSSSFGFLPVAFMVDKCNGIYVSGHGSQPGLPLTDDAIYDQDDSFYLAQLSPNAEELLFGSYYGRANHVDGGTSRFDKAGIVYQGVCSCRLDIGEAEPLDNVMITTPGAWREDQVSRCDIGVFKIDFDVDLVTAAGVASPSTSGCAPLTIDFEYTGRDGQVITWNIGNGDTAEGENFTYTFEAPGIYNVVQIATSPTSCNPTDTFRLQIDVLSDASTFSEREFCDGVAPTFLDASTPGATYRWQDGTTTATYQPEAAGIFWVDVTVGGCTRRDTFQLTPVSGISAALGDDQSYCDVSSVTLDATNAEAISYQWQDGSDQPTLDVSSSGNYSVTLTDAGGCVAQDNVIINFGEAPDFDLGDDRTVCDGETVTFDATAGGSTYTWQDGSTGPTLTTAEAGVYRVEALRDGCPTVDSVELFTDDSPQVMVSANDLLCPDQDNGTLDLVVTGGGNNFTYRWDTGETSAGRTGLAPGEYAFTVTSESGCVTSGVRTITATPPIVLTTGTLEASCDVEKGGFIDIQPITGGTPPYQVGINGGILDTTLTTQFAPAMVYSGFTNGAYTITIEDALGCVIAETVNVVAPRNIVLDAGPDRLVDFGDSVRLNAVVNLPADLTYNWLPPFDLNCTGCLTPYASPLENITYILTAVDTLSGCSYRDSVSVAVRKDFNVYVPNAFSPNGDGINDRFFINTDLSVERINSLQVYDRWGGLLYARAGIAPNDPNEGWDGTVDGRSVAGQVLVYAVEVVFKDGTTKLYEGEVLLLR